MENIYEAYGIEIIKKENKFFLRYDAGEIVVQMKEIEISEEESKKIQGKRTAKELYEFMIENFNNRMLF